MNILTATASVLALGSTLLVARASDACTDPTRGADEPTVEPSEESAEPGEAPGDDPNAGGEGSVPDPVSGGEATFSPDPIGDGIETLPSALVALRWRPGADVDADPADGYFRHGGHTIDTRVVVRDRDTGAIVHEALVPQFDYESATREDPGAVRDRLELRLPEGRYEAKVQSVFYRHDKIRYGMEGRWRSIERAGPAPAIAEGVAGVAFSVRALEASSGPTSGGCSAAGSGGLAPVALLLLLGLARRRATASAR